MPVYELRLYQKTSKEDGFDLIDRINFGAMDDREAVEIAPHVEAETFDSCDFVFLWSADGKAFWTLKPQETPAFCRI